MIEEWKNGETGHDGLPEAWMEEKIINRGSGKPRIVRGLVQLIGGFKRSM